MSLHPPSPEQAFDGVTYQPNRDYQRLNTQLVGVLEIMEDGQWHTIPEIVEVLGNATPQSVSARLRDLRKPKHGSHTVSRQYVGQGLYSYRLEM